MDVLEFAFYCVIAYVVYRILDRLIRIPKVGRYNERYILVTGCDTGFGHEIAKRLDKLGCHVFAACLTEKGETELRKNASNRLVTVSMNVADGASVRRAYIQVEKAIPKGKGKSYKHKTSNEKIEIIVFMSKFVKLKRNRVKT